MGDGAVVRGGEGSIAAEMEDIEAIPPRMDGMIAELDEVGRRIVAVANGTYGIAAAPTAPLRAGADAMEAKRRLDRTVEEVRSLQNSARTAYANYRQAEQGNIQGFEAVSLFWAIQDWVRRGRPSAFVVDRAISKLNIEKEALLLRQAAFDHDKNRAAEQVDRLKSLNLPKPLAELLDTVEDNIDDFIAPADISVSKVDRVGPPLEFNGRLEDILRPAQILEDYPGEIAISEVTTPEDKKVYIVTLPGTQLGGADDNPFDMRGIFDAMFLNSKKMSAAVAQAMESMEPPPPAGSKVYINGFSQGGIVAKNLVNSKEFEKYDVQLVWAVGSPDPFYSERDPNTTYLDTIDSSDYTPSTDGKIIPADEKNIEVRFDRLPINPKMLNPDYQDDSSILGPTHDLDQYIRSFMKLDRTEHLEIAKLEEDLVKVIPPGSIGKMHLFKMKQPRG